MALTNKQLIAIAVTIAIIVVSIWYYRTKNKPNASIQTSIPSSTVTPTSISTPSTPVALTLIPINNPSAALQSMQKTDSDLSPFYRQVSFVKPDITADQVKEILTKYPKIPSSPFETPGPPPTPIQILNLTLLMKVGLLKYALTQLNSATKTQNTPFGSLTDQNEINNGKIYLNNLKNAIDNANNYISFYNNNVNPPMMTKTS